MKMLLMKSFASIVLLVSLAQENTSTNNFEDINRENDFSTRFIENIRYNIPGEPDLDYPIYYKIPRTSFTCDNRHEGYYADIETRCQVFRICANTDLSGYGFSFLCPNGTLFSQKNFVCDWYKNVDCSESENYYFMNEKLRKTVGSKEEMYEAVKKMMEFPIKTAKNVLPKQTTLLHSVDTPQGNHQYQFSEVETTSTPQITTTSKSNTIKNFEDNNSQNNDQHETIYNKDPRSTTNIQITTKEPQSSDLRKLVLPGKVYVSNLGELSTEVGSSFDPKKSRIFGDPAKQDTQKQNALDIILDSNHNLQTESLTRRSNSFSANVNDLLTGPGTSKTYRLSDTSYESSSNKPHSTQSQESLLLSKRINAELNGLANTPVASTDHSQDNFSNKVYSVEDQLLSQSSDRSQANRRPVGLAESINFAFQTNFVQSKNRNLKKDLYNIETINSSLEDQKSLAQSHNRRSGRQFQFQGSGFTKAKTTRSRQYLPPPPNRNSSSAGYKANEIVQELTTLEPLISDYPTLSSLIINVEDVDELDDLHTTTENSVHVKKRAERLLLQGVHLTLYDTDNNNFEENTINNNLAKKQKNQAIRTTPATTNNYITSTPPTSTPFSKTSTPLLPRIKHIRRQPPSVVRINTRTTSTPVSSKSRKRPKNRFANKYSEQISIISSSTEPTAENDLTPQANSYGARSVFNRFNRNEANKYTVLRRTKSIYDKQNNTNTINILSLNNSTYSPTAALGSTTKLNSNLQVSVSNQFNQSLRPGTRTRIQASIQGTGSTYSTFKPITSKQNTEPSSSYAELPGTSVVIAKSQEQGSFAISNDPIFNTGFQSGQSSDPSTVYHSLEEFLMNTFLGKNQKPKPQANSQQIQSYEQQKPSFQSQSYQQLRPMYKPYYQQQKQNIQSQSYKPIKQPYQPELHQQPKQTYEKPTTDFFPSFLNVQTTKSTTEKPFNPFPLLSQHVSANTITTPSSITRSEPYQTPNSYSGDIDIRFDQTSHLQAAQRRLDVEENEKEEGRLYEGVSSYHVPLNSVGRLPGDIVARRKRS